MKSPFWSEPRVTQEFGENAEYYKQFGLKGHEGIDMVPTGKNWQIIAVAPGKVVMDEDKPSRIYGKQVRIKSKDGRVWCYCHLAENVVSLGDDVVEGDPIGLMGNTGTGTGAHLHLMTYREDSAGKRLFADNGYRGCENPRGYL